VFIREHPIEDQDFLALGMIMRRKMRFFLVADDGGNLTGFRRSDEVQALTPHRSARTGRPGLCLCIDRDANCEVAMDGLSHRPRAQGSVQPRSIWATRTARPQRSRAALLPRVRPPGAEHSLGLRQQDRDRPVNHRSSSGGPGQGAAISRPALRRLRGRMIPRCPRNTARRSPRRRQRNERRARRLGVR